MKNKKKKPEKKKIINILIISIATIIILGAIILALYYEQNEITFEATAEIIEGCGEGTTFYKFTDICWQKSIILETMSWENANLYCRNLTLGGKSNWRPPTLEELRRIIKFTPGKASIDTDFFENAKETFYWTSTKYPLKENFHTFIHFKSGYEGFAADYMEYGIICVRTNF